MCPFFSRNTCLEVYLKRNLPGAAFCWGVFFPQCLTLYTNGLKVSQQGTWVAQSLSISLWLRSWSHSLWVPFPHQMSSCAASVSMRPRWASLLLLSASQGMLSFSLPLTRILSFSLPRPPQKKKKRLANDVWGICWLVLWLHPLDSFLEVLLPHCHIGCLTLWPMTLP